MVQTTLDKGALRSQENGPRGLRWRHNEAPADCHPVWVPPRPSEQAAALAVAGQTPQVHTTSHSRAAKLFTKECEPSIYPGPVPGVNPPCVIWLLEKEKTLVGVSPGLQPLQKKEVETSQSSGGQGLLTGRSAGCEGLGLRPSFLLSCDQAIKQRAPASGEAAPLHLRPSHPLPVPLPMICRESPALLQSRSPAMSSALGRWECGREGCSPSLWWSSTPVPASLGPRCPCQPPPRAPVVSLPSALTDCSLHPWAQPSPPPPPPAFTHSALGWCWFPWMPFLSMITQLR